MAADNTTERLRATMRAALERKQSNDRGVEHKTMHAGGAPRRTAQSAPSESSNARAGKSVAEVTLRLGR